MASKPTCEVRTEIVRILEGDRTRLGEVYRLTELGRDQYQIASELGVKTSGFVSNYRTILAALLDGTVPNGASLAQSVASRVRTILKSQMLSEDARAYLRALTDEIDPTPRGGPRVERRTHVSTSSVGANLRAAVESEVRTRANDLITRIRSEVDLDADDYYRVISAAYALDQLVDLIDRQTPSATSLALFQGGWFELSIEHAVISWAEDLPLASSLVESARGRLEYWRSE